MKRFANPDQLNLLEADSYAEKVKYGHALQEGTIAFKVFKSIQQRFYSGSPFDGAHATFSPLVASIERASDGDTCTVNGAIVNNQPVPIKLTLRLDGIDTPESYRGRYYEDKVTNKKAWEPNSKLDTFRNYIWLLFKETFRFGDNIERVTPLIAELMRAGSDDAKLNRVWATMSNVEDNADRQLIKIIEDRIVYDGLIAGAVTKGLVALSRGRPFTIDPSFARSSTDPAECNVADFQDVYGRGLGRIRPGLPNEPTNILALFVANELPKIMNTHGREYYNFFHDGTVPSQIVDGDNSWIVDSKTGQQSTPAALTPYGKALLEAIKRRPDWQPLWQALSPETLPKPWEIFTPEKCKQLSEEWVAFTNQGPAYKNDVQAMLVFLGLAYAYPKYRNQFMDEYLKAEISTQRYINRPHGLWEDPIFRLMQPNQKSNPLFARFEKALSRGRNLLPEDCCTALLRENRDIYNHCKR